MTLVVVLGRCRGRKNLASVLLDFRSRRGEEERERVRKKGRDETGHQYPPPFALLPARIGMLRLLDRLSIDGQMQSQTEEGDRCRGRRKKKKRKARLGLARVGGRKAKKKAGQARTGGKRERVGSTRPNLDFLN